MTASLKRLCGNDINYLAGAYRSAGGKSAGFMRYYIIFFILHELINQTYFILYTLLNYYVNKNY